MKFSIAGKITIAIVIFFIFFNFLLLNRSHAELVKYEDWETGEQNYYDVYNYSELYSVFEDLNYDYHKLIDEYYNLEREVEEKNIDISKLEEEIQYLKEELKGEQIKNSNITNSNDWMLIFIPTIILGTPILINYLKNKRNI